MEGAAIRVTLSNPQHGWNKESTPSEILGDTPAINMVQKRKMRMPIILVGLVE